MKIGLVGLGRMGRAIQARLADRGVEVIGWDRDAVAMQAAADNGMAVAAHPRAVADRADRTVISIITEDNGVRAIFRGKDGILSGNVRGMLLVETSTFAADNGARACSGRRGCRRPADQLAGARHHPLGPRRQALRHGRRQSRRRRRRPCGSRKAHPQDRAHGSNGAGYAMKLAANLGLAAFIQATAKSPHSAPAKACRCSR